MSGGGGLRKRRKSCAKLHSLPRRVDAVSKAEIFRCFLYRRSVFSRILIRHTRFLRAPAHGLLCFPERSRPFRKLYLAHLFCPFFSTVCRPSLFVRAARGTLCFEMSRTSFQYPAEFQRCTAFALCLIPSSSSATLYQISWAILFHLQQVFGA